MADAKKDTIYVDVDDEITVIIDKVRSSASKVIALVLPKRATTLQSVVNLKLLKRAATQSKKNIVLITSEPNIVALAGGVGLHVAKTLQSKPEVPTLHVVDNSGDGPVETEEPVVEAAAPAAAALAAEDTIELDNETEAIDLDDKKKPVKEGKLKNKIKIPDFDRFRLLLFGGIALLILLIVGGVFAFVILPKANITLTTDSSSQTVDMNITAKKDATLDPDNKTVPLISKDSKKTESEKVPATGQRDDGEKAKGTVTLTNCTSVEGNLSVPAGTVLSTNGLNFTTDETVTIPESAFSGQQKCKPELNGSFKNVTVTAQGAGSTYNLSAHRTYSTSISGLTGTDSTAMTGGTSKLTQVVSQSDLDNAKQRVLDRLNANIGNEIKSQFESDGVIALTDTLKNTDPVVSSTPKVGETATDVTVQVVITYSEAGVKKDDIKQLVEAEANKHIDASKQTIQDNGLDKVVVHITDNKAPTQVNFGLQTIVVAGPQLDGDGIKKEIAGKRKGDTTRIIQSRPGIKDVDIKYSPFWVFSTPKNIKHITITFKQPDEH